MNHITEEQKQLAALESVLHQKKREKKPHKFVFHPIVSPTDPSVSVTSDGSLYKTDDNGTLHRLNKGMNKKERRKQHGRVM